MNSKISKAHVNPIEGIDLNKLGIVIRSNWIWIVLILLLINLVSFIKIRYTPGLYQSESDVKLEVKNEASDWGIKSFVNESQNDLLSGEIELIQSKLFLGSVRDSMPDLSLSFFSVGRILDYDLYGTHPAFINYKIIDGSIYNKPIYYRPISNTEYSLTIENLVNEKKAEYGEKISIAGAEMIVRKNTLFEQGDEIGYYFILNSRDVLLNYLLTNLNVEPLNFNAKTLRIAFKDNNPFKAQAILHKIDTLYLQYSNDQKNLATKQKIDWLTHELHQIEKKMEDYENYFEDFTLQNKTNDLDAYLQNTVATIFKVDTQRFVLTNRINEINKLSDDLNSNDHSAILSQHYALPEYLNKSIDAIQTIVLEQEKLKLSYNEVTYAYRTKQKEIDNLRSKMNNQLNGLKKDMLIKLQQLNQKKNKLEQDFASMPDKNTVFTKNQRFYKLYEEFYFTLMQAKSQFEIAKAGSTSDYKILSPATLPSVPISPNKIIIAGIGIVSSFALVLFFIGVLYLINNKITNANEIEQVSEVPLLGVVPSSRYTNGKGLYVLEHPKSMVSEAIRTLRTNLDFFSVNADKKVIAISSTVSGEGKSFIAMNLGAVMALSNKKVILLDLDMRKAKTNFSISSEDNNKGVSTILIRKNTWRECLVNTLAENFDYIPSGPHPPNPSELLLNGEFASLLEDLKNHYDFILLDTPPVGLVTDGIMAMKRADISIYIFRANYSKKDFLLNLKRIITVNKFTNIATVLNSLASTDKNGYGYGYYEESHKPYSLRSLFKKT